MKKLLLILSMICGFGCKYEDKSFEENLLGLHNKERTSRGYEKLVLDEKLCEYAQKHAEYMASKNSLKHSSMSSLMKFIKVASVVGENIAWGQEDEKLVMSSWMHSPMHRANILSSNYTKIGIGMKLDKNSRKYWCVVFSN